MGKTDFPQKCLRKSPLNWYVKLIVLDIFRQNVKDRVTEKIIIA